MTNSNKAQEFLDKLHAARIRQNALEEDKAKDMLNPDKIKYWLSLATEGDNKKESNNFNSSFGLNLLSAKMLVDRWDLITTDIILHSSKKHLFDAMIPKQKEYVTYEANCPNSMYGADITFSDLIPEDKCLVLNYPVMNSRYVATFNTKELSLTEQINLCVKEIKEQKELYEDLKKQIEELNTQINKRINKMDDVQNSVEILQDRLINLLQQNKDK